MHMVTKLDPSLTTDALFSCSGLRRCVFFPRPAFTASIISVDWATPKSCNMSGPQQSCFLRSTHAPDGYRYVINLNCALEPYPHEYPDNIEEEHKDHKHGCGNSDETSMVSTCDSLNSRSAMVEVEFLRWPRNT